MQSIGVISKIDEPTEWCAGMVVVPKQSGKVRICVDLTKLNESVCRENHPLPAVNQTLGQLANAKVFSKIDANSGFWQIELAAESAKFTTFITPFGRFHFNRLPFGISRAPEHFQKRMSEILDGLDGVLCQADDILAHGATQAEHDARLTPVLCRLETTSVTLNHKKCEFSKSEIKFLGHIVGPNGVGADPEKIRAISEMPELENVSDVRRFLGMTNQLNKFSPTLAEKSKPLRELLNKENQWAWDTPQKEAFKALKKELCSTPVLTHYNPSFETTVSADVSSHGLGAVIMQKQENGNLRPVAYALRSMSATRLELL